MRLITFAKGWHESELATSGAILTRKGQVVIQPQFDEADSFSEGMARVKVGEEERYIDMMGDFMW